MRRAVVCAVLLLATPAYAQAPGASCEEQLTAMTRAVNSLFEASQQAQRSEARAKKLQAEMDKLKPPAPSTPKAPGQ